MTEDEILQTPTRILRDLLMDDSIVLAMDTRREDVPAWDSFNYINFIVALEMCSHLNRSNIGVQVIAHRLPRLSTDQTATIPPVAARDPLEAMLPIIREVQSTVTPAKGSTAP